MSENPFVVGARVAIRTAGWGAASYREAFVEKVYKGGNFTLRGAGTQQWRPRNSFGRWSASKTGTDRWSRELLVIWDGNTDKEAGEARAHTARMARLNRIRARLGGIDEATDAMLDAIEAALPAKGAPP